ncbi:MAG: NAD(P)-dependent oxidoreductase [Chloroflexi bacterium]|nr:NAD(P)-dependent oxidoreductase [Chloroflexota bacterium]
MSVILITGAGLLGAYSAAGLAARGDTVVLFDVAPNAKYLASVLGDIPVTVVTGDVRDLPLLLWTAQTHRVEVIIHTAAIIAGRAQINAYQSHAVNVGGTMHVLEVARAVQARRIVYTSTYGVYDMARCQMQPIAEDAAVLQDFDLVYSATKYAAECLLSATARTHHLSVVTLRLASVFGYGTFAGGAAGGAAIDMLMRCALRGEPAPILPGVRVRNEWLYVRDAAGAVVAACNSAADGPYTVYNVGTGTLHAMDDLLKAIRGVVPTAQFVPAGDQGVMPPERAQPFDLSNFMVPSALAPAGLVGSATPPDKDGPGHWACRTPDWALASACGWLVQRDTPPAASAASFALLADLP